MFSPNSEGGPATATRSRRRQRSKTTEPPIAQQPRAKRQRLPLTEQTVNTPEVQPETQEVKNDRDKDKDKDKEKEKDKERLAAAAAAAPVAVQSQSQSQTVVDAKVVPPTLRKEMALRVSKPKHGERAAQKSDGSLILTSNNAYTVSKLPALPDRLRNDWSGPQHADVFSSSGYALHLTPTHAIVWPYNSTSQSPETFTFDLPAPSRPSDGLPVGCLVAPSASSNEPGLVVVTASGGKVVFWESISSAATFAFIKKDRLGVEHTIYGLSSGEKVVAITNAESAGFILTFNSGRLAYMNVRDSYGRPAISVQFLRTNLTNGAGGLFGSIRSAFGNLGLKGDIAAVRADRNGRVGERSIVALSNKGKLQCWRIHRGGHNEPAGEADMRDAILSKLWAADALTRHLPAESFEALDFAFVPSDVDPKYAELTRLSNVARAADPSIQHLLLLVSLTEKSVSRYALVEVVLTPRDCQVGIVRPIRSYSTPSSLSSPSTLARPSSKPQLYLPRPAMVAFIVFDRAAVVASLAVSPDSPDAQLRPENHKLSSLFEDVVDFREDDVHEIVGSGFEETPAASGPGPGGDEGRAMRPKSSRHPAAILVVRGAGVVRIATTDVEKFASERPPKISAKNKIEQAVFFGTKQHNPLVFDARTDLQFSAEETMQAALQVSSEILSSSTPYMSTLPASLEDNLLARSHALQRLMQHLEAVGAYLDRRTRWSLLFNAEKMHVATLLWRLQEKFVVARPTNDKKTIIGNIVEFIHQDQKHNPSAEQGEVDRVRHWFINDVFRLELFVAWAYEVIKLLWRDKLLDDGKVTTMICEAIEINMAAHSGALEFRKNNLGLYGLRGEKMKLGILQEGFEGLPEPWTASHFLANNLARLAELSNQWYTKWSRESKSSAKPDPKLLERIYNASPALVDGMLTAILEYALWALTTPDQKTTGQTFFKEYQKMRYDRPIGLARLGKWEDGAIIAEKHGSLGGLAVILLGHIEELEMVLAEPGLNAFEIQNLRALREGKKAQLEDRLAKYGRDFAFPMYEDMLEKHGIRKVLDFQLETSGFKTQYLRSRPELARISWINDIQREHDVGSASHTLVLLALEKEQQVWAKKIELSLGKLALLVEAEQQSNSTSPPSSMLKTPADEVRHDQQLQKVERELVTVKIQDKLYALVYKSTHDAIDDAAALNLAMDAHAGLIPKKQKAVRQVFEEGLGGLLKHRALEAMTLIDLLTLAEWKPAMRGADSNPFWLALNVAESSCHGDEVREAKRLIWRRLFIRDDWAKINDTQQLDDVEVVTRLAETELYVTLLDCVKHHSRSGLRPMAPAEALGAFTSHLDRRHRDCEASTQRRLVEANQAEDELLTKYIEKSRLAEWLRTALEAAQTELEVVEADNKAVAEALAQQQKQQKREKRHEKHKQKEKQRAMAKEVETSHDLGMSMPGGTALFGHA